MAQTLINSDGLAAGCIIRSKLNTTTAASAVISKVIQGAGISITSTGVDAGTGDVTVTALPTAIPGNGWYLPSTNTLGVSTNGISRGSISANGNWSIAAPTSTSSTVGGYAANVQAPTTPGASFGLLILAGTNATDLALQVLNAAGSADLFAVSGSGVINLPSVATQTTSPGAGGATALPATPKGYFAMTLAGYAAKIPYY